MKTRTLLLLSLACGMAIMLAGAALLVQLATSDDVEAPFAVGESAVVGDMTVDVRSVDERVGRLAVVVELGGAADDDPASDFRLIASGRPLAPIDSTCAAIAADAPPSSCEVAFDVSSADGTSRLLLYERGDDRARWRLD